MIDLHSHILPALDDGPETVEGSLALARGALAAGTTKLVATPHINRRYDLHPSGIREAVAALRARLEVERIELELLMGAEISTGRLPSLSREDLDALRLGDGPYLLLEVPLGPGIGTLPSAVERLQRDGYGVLLAHPERSPGLQRDPAKLRRLVETGALCSITAGSLSGRFGQTPRRFALTLLREGLVHDVASDTHDAVRRTPELLPGLSDAAADLPGLREQVPWLTEDAPAAILSGAPLPRRPPLPSPRRRSLLPWRA
ncbi:MAG TPA: CpsB/CapC family capsule biosynthesis tyrosine phosphatase [Solirubrobacteraceae bacterium]|jgi:protein-tyrosine phosphatase